ncbi:CAP domain-containing protein [Virgibacillus ihumii]|uniref:CAP domain-containing protein n=1 Tax=Virgibacillus ihumii TaxID=2686091 RepID=UPI00157CCD89|nr:CAP domain-containing protein [Virgibacillus ihumii]
MLNKLVVTTVSAAVLFGGAFQTTTDASANTDKSQNQSQQNSDCFQFSKKELDNFLNKYFGNVDWEKVNVNKQVTAQQEKPEPKKETKQPVPEQNTQQQDQQAQPEQNKQSEQQQEPAEQVQAPQQEQTEAPAKQQTQQQNQTTQQQQQNNSQAYQLSQYEKKVVELTNQERTERGLEPLEISTELSKVAREKSRDMAENNYFSHNSPTYGSPFDMMKQFGITYKTAGENIARGQQTPQEVVNGWMNSEGHRANILNESFTHIGVGYVENGNYWTQQFIGK